jgi:eukaryotic-like serine/threonine-protein kinase
VTRQKWRFSIHNDDIYASPTVANGIVYIGTQGGFFALDAETGLKKWGFEDAGFINSSACVLTTQGKVYRGLGNVHP